MENKNNIPDITKEKFKFSTEQRQYAEKIDGKPIGALEDAIRRFVKNRAALVAFIMLSILLIFVLFGQLMVPYKYDEVSSGKNLSPKIQLVEKIGIFDGKQEKEHSGYKFSDLMTKIKAEYADFNKNGNNYEIKLAGNLTDNPGQTQIIVRPDETTEGIGLEKLEQYATDNPNRIFIVDGNVFVDTEGNGVEKLELISSGVEKTSGVEITQSQYNAEYDQYIFKGLTEDDYHWFGTDASGRDLFARCWKAARLSLMIGTLAAIFNLIVGIIYGAISGYYGGGVDMIMQRILEILGGVPWFVVFMIMISKFGANQWTIIFAFVITGWVGISKVTRMQYLRYRNREYVLAARSVGVRDRGLMFKHILPNGIGTLITSSVLIIPAAIFGESGFAALGLGIEGQISLGTLISDARDGFLGAERILHTMFAPIIIIGILMLSFNMIGNGLRDAFNPALRGK